MERMDLVRSNAGSVVPVEIPSPGNTELSLGVVMESFQLRIGLVDNLDVRHHGEHVDDGLGINPRDGCAANVVQGHQICSKRGGDLGACSRKPYRPLRVTRYYDDAPVQSEVLRRLTVLIICPPEVGQVCEQF